MVVTRSFLEAELVSGTDRFDDCMEKPNLRKKRLSSKEQVQSQLIRVLYNSLPRIGLLRFSVAMQHFLGSCTAFLTHVPYDC